MIELREELVPSSIDMRDIYCNTMIELAKEDDRIFMIDVDCMHSMGTEPFIQQFPDRYVNPGIMEMQTVGMAAGMAAENFIPFINGFGAFTSRRAYDQLFQSCAYAKLNVKIVGWDSGISATSNGGTHMPFEDIGMLRGIPTLVLLDVADTTSLAEALKETAKYDAPVYIRTFRRDVTEIYKPGSKFTIGKANLLRDGDDVTIIACGTLVAEALKAAAALETQGISARVVDMFTIKPLDEEIIIESAKKTGAIVTAENGNIAGGLGAAVSLVAAKHAPVPMEYVAVEDEFGEVGDITYLRERFKLNAANIEAKVKAAIARK